MTVHDGDMRGRPFERGQPRRQENVRAGRPHSLGGQHLSSITQACMCLQACCHGASGCICTACSGFGHVNCRGAWELAAEAGAATALPDASSRERRAA